jgi:phosphoglycerate kinase
MKILGLKDLSMKGSRVLLRVDFNVPINGEGTITDDSRIRASLPTIEYILGQGASLVIMSHLGRPKGVDLTLSLAPCARRLSELLGKPVLMAPDCVGPVVEKMARQLKEGSILMLENLRFHEAEEAPEKDPGFVASLALLGDVYVNDAFGTAHRAHSSTALIAKYFRRKAAAGFLMEEEIRKLSPLLNNPPKPFYALIGGAKISTKAGVIDHLLGMVDALFIGGAMAFTFLKAKGFRVGHSLVEEGEIRTAKSILSKARNLYLPLDFVIADRFAEDSQKKVVLIEEGIPPLWQGMDIGPKTIESWSKTLSDGATIFWNGPLGVFEIPSFSKGTYEIAQMLAASNASVTIGGGDSVAAVQQMGLGKCFSHLSTGGGASLEFLEYGHLPGIDALSFSFLYD